MHKNEDSRVVRKSISEFERIVPPFRAVSWFRRCGIWLAGCSTDLGCALIVVFAIAPTVCGVVHAEEMAELSPNSEDSAANQFAQEVFAGPEYWWKRTTDVKSASFISRILSNIHEYLIAPVLNFLWDMLEWILKLLFGDWGKFTGDWSQGIPFLWVIIGVLVLITAWRMYGTFQRRTDAAPSTVDRQEIEELPKPDQLLEQAQAALDRGDHRVAVRLTFMSLLAWLQAQGQLKYDPSRSNREYERELRKWPESVTCFRAVELPFEVCWYGGRQLNTAQVQEVIALCANQLQLRKGDE